MYKLYQSRKVIPWINATMEDVPNYRISDDWFNFQEVSTNTIYFETWNRGRIIIKDEGIHYFKLAYSDTNKRNTYWYVNKVLKVLKDGFEVELIMDIYMTYTKEFISYLVSNKNPIVERLTITSRMFHNSQPLRKLCYYSFKLDDELLTNALQSYDLVSVHSQRVEEGQFPLKVHTARGDGYIHYNKTTDGTKNNTFTQNLGVYAIFYTIDGDYHIYPINEGKYRMTLKGANGPYNIVNNKDTIFKYFVARKGKWIQDIYAEGSFLGLFKGPVFFQSTKRDDFKVQAHI